jgi:sulfite exporter TauE/SafE
VFNWLLKNAVPCKCIYSLIKNAILKSSFYPSLFLLLEFCIDSGIVMGTFKYKLNWVSGIV